MPNHSVKVMQTGVNSIQLNTDTPVDMVSGRVSQRNLDGIEFEFKYGDQIVLHLRITGGGEIHWDVPSESSAFYISANELAKQLKKIDGKSVNPNRFSPMP